MGDKLKKENIPKEDEEKVIAESDENKLIQERYCDYIVDKYGNWVPFY